MSHILNFTVIEVIANVSGLVCVSLISDTKF